ncbi:hypothetical protein LLG90_08260 [Aromatoleum toluclasticum]|uniref:hypothetical protein n=1 Tax=Aromatoleum toluclasticum TaxID=92003 RepID=UPI001D192153|nr:hypothetical protein [Aromatoleum toluclasticum]MCC4115337.1 hypothetical protein [Aromatoleum toluclasticum]
MNSSKPFIDALYSGDESAAAAALDNLLTPQGPSADEIARQLVPQVAQQIQADDALRQARQRHPEVFHDRDLANAADGRVTDLLRQGKPLPKAIGEAVEQVAQKFGRGREEVPARHEDADDRSRIIREMAAQRAGGRQ